MDESDILSDPDQRNMYRSRLIELVRASPILWDQRSLDCSQRAVKTQKWLEVSEKLGVSVDKVRRTWENLRDQYRRDLKRTLRTGCRSQWRFFDDMGFIRAMVRIKEFEYQGKWESESESEDVCGAGLAKASAATAPPLNFMPIQLNTDWKQLIEAQQMQQLCPPLQQGRAKQQREKRPQHCSQMRQLFDQQEQHLDHQQQKAQQPQQQQRCDPLQQLSDQLTAQHCDSSEDQKFSGLEVVDMSDVIKVELNSDSSSWGRKRKQQGKEQPAAPPLEVRPSPSPSASCAARNLSEQCVSTSDATSSRRKRPSCSADAPAQVDGKRSRSFLHEDELRHCAELQDEDYHFVMSILPSLRQVTRQRQFPLRSQIMALISRELDEANE